MTTNKAMSPAGMDVLGKVEIDAMVEAIVKDGEARARRGKEAPQTMEPLSAEACQGILGLSTAVKINYIPMMLCSLARKEAQALVEYGAAHRVSEIKKHSRVLRDLLGEYDRYLRGAYKNAYGAYCAYTDRFEAVTAVNVWKMQLYADTLAANQHPGRPHRDIAVHALLCSMLIDYCDEYDDKVDRMLTEKLSRPVNRRRDTLLQCIKITCTSLRVEPAFSLTPDETISTWIGVLSNQAWHLVDEIIEEEDKLKD